MKIKEVKKYYKITENFIKNNPIKEIIGIPSLNPHSPRSLKKWNLRSNKNLLRRILTYLSKIFFKSKNFYSFKDKKYDYLIFSHLVSYENLNYLNDFYFGNLAEKLGKDRVLIVLFDAIGFDQNKIQKNVKGNYIILSKSLGFLNELFMHINTAYKIFVKSFTSKDLNLFNIHNITTSVDNQRIAIQFKKIIKMNQPKTLIYTMEGNPYEWLICKVAHELNKNIFRIGYQFSVIRNFHRSLFININCSFEPDHVLTIGKYNKKKLDLYFNNKLKVTNIGNIKKKKFRFKKKKLKKKLINILVMPEGIPHEINLMLNYCIKNIDQNINYTFRLHPIYKKKKEYLKLIKQYNYNIKLSVNDLNYDFKKNDFILYRGTAAVIDAINFGLKPIYLKTENEISIDPLFEINDSYMINYKSNLKKFIVGLRKNKSIINELNGIKKFTIEYYDKFKFNKLYKVLKN